MKHRRRSTPGPPSLFAAALLCPALCALAVATSSLLPDPSAAEGSAAQASTLDANVGEVPHVGGWVLERQADGIDVYTRTVPGSEIKAFRGEGVVEADLERVLGVLRDSDHYQDWFPHCPESKLLQRDGPVSYQYSVTAAPWPIDDRDNIFRSVLARDAETGVVEITVTAAPDAYPEQPGRVRVQSARGGWRLEPAGEHRTHVVFTMHLEPGGGVPAWMANARVLATPFDALTNLRRVVAR